MTESNDSANEGESFAITPAEREQIEKTRAGGDPPIKEEDRVATVGDIDKSLEKQEQARMNAANQAVVRDELDAAVDAPIKADERLNGAKEHQIVNIKREAFERVAKMPTRASMSGDELKSALGKAAKEIIDEEFAFHGAKETAAKKDDLDKRLEAAAKAGEAGGDSGARSAGEGSAKPGSNKEFALTEPEWMPGEQRNPIPTDAEVDLAAKKEADRLMAAMD